MNDAHLLEQIKALLARPRAGEPDPSLAELEHTLTSGYARAHSLEAEQLRLDRRIAEVAALLAAEGAGRHGADLSALAARKTEAEGELKRLRGLLRALRDRAAAARAV